MPDAGACGQAVHMRGVRGDKRPDDAVHGRPGHPARQHGEEAVQGEEEDAASPERGEEEQARLPLAVPGVAKQPGSLCGLFIAYFCTF